MTIAGGFVIFIVWWWLVFLAILPRNVTARWETDDDGVKGADPGAPVAPQIGKKARLTTIITLVLTAVTIAIIMSGIVDFRD